MTNDWVADNRSRRPVCQQFMRVSSSNSWIYCCHSLHWSSFVNSAFPPSLCSTVVFFLLYMPECSFSYLCKLKKVTVYGLKMFDFFARFPKPRFLYLLNFFANYKMYSLVFIMIIVFVFSSLLHEIQHVMCHPFLFSLLVLLTVELFHFSTMLWYLANFLRHFCFQGDMI